MKPTENFDRRKVDGINYVANGFPQRLRELRLKSGESQQEVAFAVGMAQATYSHWEQGIRDPTSATLVRLANHFNVSIDFLLGNETVLRDNEKDNGTVKWLEMVEKAKSAGYTAATAWEVLELVGKSKAIFESNLRPA